VMLSGIEVTPSDTKNMQTLILVGHSLLARSRSPRAISLLVAATSGLIVLLSLHFNNSLTLISTDSDSRYTAQTHYFFWILAGLFLSYDSSFKDLLSLLDRCHWLLLSAGITFLAGMFIASVLAGLVLRFSAVGF